MPDFVRFDDFYQKSIDARYEHHRETLKWASVKAGNPAPDDDEAEAEFGKMKAFVVEHYEGVKAEHSFLDLAGNHFDCIPFDQVPMVRKAKGAGHAIQAVPPALPPADARPIDPKFPTVPIKPPLGQGAVDLYGHPLACPEGCVALRRTSVDRMSVSGKFDRFFKKSSGGQFRHKATKSVAPASVIAPETASTGHQYGIVQDETAPNLQYSGAGSWMNIWDPNPGPAGMSLSQLWIVGGDYSVEFTDPNVNPQALQTIEGGWMVQPEVFTTTLPVIFVYFNPDGYLIAEDPAGRGGYLTNQNHFGFIPSPNAPWPIAGAFGASDISTAGGAQCEFWMRWIRDSTTGNWFLFLGSTPDDAVSIGYFPQFLYAPGALGVGPATTVQFGGEVSPPITPIPMGSGNHPTGNPTADYQSVAYQRDVSIQVQGESALRQAAIAVTSSNDPPYGVAAGNNPNWSTFFFFGG